MTQPEFQAWVEFYKMNPFDDYHRHYRPAALVAHAMTGTDLDDLLGWLEKRTPTSNGYNAADLASMKALGMKPPRRD